MARDYDSRHQRFTDFVIREVELDLSAQHEAHIRSDPSHPAHELSEILRNVRSQDEMILVPDEDGAEPHAGQTVETRYRDEPEPSVADKAWSDLTPVCPECKETSAGCLPFCTKCGSESLSEEIQGAQPALLITGFRDATARKRFAQLLWKSLNGASPKQIESMLDELPALFRVRSTPAHTMQLVKSLKELGVEAAAVELDESIVLWYTETFEHIRRNPAKIVNAAILGILVASLFALSAGLGTVGAFVAVIAYVGFQMHWYHQKFALSADRFGPRLNGMDPDVVQSFRGALQLTASEDLRNILSLCLREYQAICRTISQRSSALSSVAQRAKPALHQLVSQIVQACTKHAKLEQYKQGMSISQLESEIRKLREEISATTDESNRANLQRTLERRRMHMETLRELAQAERKFRTQLQALSATLEAMRAQFLSLLVGRGSSANAQQSVDRLLQDLDDEMKVINDTLEEVSAHSLPDTLPG